MEVVLLYYQRTIRHPHETIYDLTDRIKSILQGNKIMEMPLNQPC